MRRGEESRERLRGSPVKSPLIETLIRKFSPRRRAQHNNYAAAQSDDLCTLGNGDSVGYNGLHKDLVRPPPFAKRTVSTKGDRSYIGLSSNEPPLTASRSRNARSDENLARYRIVGENAKNSSISNPRDCDYNSAKKNNSNGSARGHSAREEHYRRPEPPSYLDGLSVGDVISRNRQNSVPSVTEHSCISVANAFPSNCIASSRPGDENDVLSSQLFALQRAAASEQDLRLASYGFGVDAAPGPDPSGLNVVGNRLSTCLSQDSVLQPLHQPLNERTPSYLRIGCAVAGYHAYRYRPPTPLGSNRPTPTRSSGSEKTAMFGNGCDNTDCNSLCNGVSTHPKGQSMVERRLGQLDSRDRASTDPNSFRNDKFANNLCCSPNDSRFVTPPSKVSGNSETSSSVKKLISAFDKLKLDSPWTDDSVPHHGGAYFRSAYSPRKLILDSNVRTSRNETCSGIGAFISPTSSVTQLQNVHCTKGINSPSSIGHVTNDKDSANIEFVQTNGDTSLPTATLSDKPIGFKRADTAKGGITSLDDAKGSDNVSVSHNGFVSDLRQQQVVSPEFPSSSLMNGHVNGLPSCNSDGLIPFDESSQTFVKPGVTYRKILSEERSKLNKITEELEELKNEPDVPEEGTGQIRIVIGKALLLLGKKMDKFSELCDRNLEGGSGYGSVQNQDLIGYWDLVEMEIKDIMEGYAAVVQARNAGWPMKESSTPPSRTAKARPRAKPPIAPSGKSAANGSAATKKANAEAQRMAARARVREARLAAMKNKQSSLQGSVNGLQNGHGDIPVEFCGVTPDGD